MALKIAPEQGWGVYWNALHPGQPFTPIEVNLAPAATTVASSSSHVSLPGGGAQTSLPGYSQASVLGVMTELHIPAGLQGGNSSGTAASGTGDTGTVASLSLNHLHFLDDGWNVVPSVANETGQGYATSDAAWDIAGGDFSSDWFFV